MQTVTILDRSNAATTKQFSNSLSTVNFLSTLSTEEPTVAVFDTHVRLTYSDHIVTVEGTTIDRMLKAFDGGECPKCEGEGWIDVYAHVKGGVCFKCGGTGINPKN